MHKMYLPNFSFLSSIIEMYLSFLISLERNIFQSLFKLDRESNFMKTTNVLFSIVPLIKVITTPHYSIMIEFASKGIPLENHST